MHTDKHIIVESIRDTFDAFDMICCTLLLFWCQTKDSALTTIQHNAQQCTKNNVTRAHQKQRPKMPDFKKEQNNVRSDSLSVCRLPIQFLMFLSQPANKQPKKTSKTIVNQTSLWTVFSSFCSACIEEPTRRETIVFISIHFYWIGLYWKITGNVKRKCNVKKISHLVLFCYLWWRWNKNRLYADNATLWAPLHKEIPVRRFILHNYFFSVLLSWSVQNKISKLNCVCVCA